MPFDGLGNFTRSYNFTADKLAAIKIQSVRVDGEFDNYATGMNEVLLRNGVAPMTGDLKLGDNEVTGIASGSDATPSIRFDADTTTGLFLVGAGVLGFTAGGAEKFRLNDLGASVTGLLGLNTAAPRTALDVIGFSSFRAIFEDCPILATAISGTVYIDAATQATIVLDSDAVGNWTFDIRGDAGTTLDSLMGVGQALTLAVEVPQGNPAYYCTAITVDGGAPAQTKWFNGGAPGFGNITGIDVYTITVIKKAAATFYVRASQTQVK